MLAACVCVFILYVIACSAKRIKPQKDVPVPFLCEAKKLDGAGEEEDAEYEAGDEPENEDVTLLRSMVNGVTMNGTA